MHVNISWGNSFHDEVSLHGQNMFVEESSFIHLCFVSHYLFFHQEKGHVTHKESKKQGGKSSRKLRTYRTFSGRKRLLAIFIPSNLEVSITTLESWQFENATLWNSVHNKIWMLSEQRKTLKVSVEEPLQVTWDEHNCTVSCMSFVFMHWKIPGIE